MVGPWVLLAASLIMYPLYTFIPWAAGSTDWEKIGYTLLITAAIILVLMIVVTPIIFIEAIYKWVADVLSSGYTTISYLMSQQQSELWESIKANWAFLVFALPVYVVVVGIQFVSGVSTIQQVLSDPEPDYLKVAIVSLSGVLLVALTAGVTNIIYWLIGGVEENLPDFFNPEQIEFSSKNYIPITYLLGFYSISTALLTVLDDSIFKSIIQWSALLFLMPVNILAGLQSFHVARHGVKRDVIVQNWPVPFYTERHNSMCTLPSVPVSLGRSERMGGWNKIYSCHNQKDGHWATGYHNV